MASFLSDSFTGVVELPASTFLSFLAGVVVFSLFDVDFESFFFAFFSDFLAGIVAFPVSAFLTFSEGFVELSDVAV